MQFRYLIFGLVLAAIFVAANWINGLPGIPPVRLPASEVPAAGADGTSSEEDETEERFRLWEEEYQRNNQEAEAVVLPPLNDSDGWLRERLAEEAVPWLAETELVRTVATVLENGSRGELPRKFLGFLAPKGKFVATNVEGNLRIRPDSYKRYDSFVSTLETLPPARAAELFRLVEPLLAEAIRELGVDMVTPRQLAYTALGVALATPIVDSRVLLEQPKVMYTYADEALEDLAPLQKQLLRMGPDNMRVVRIWLEDFGLALSPAVVMAPANGAGSATTEERPTQRQTDREASSLVERLAEDRSE